MCKLSDNHLLNVISILGKKLTLLCQAIHMYINKICIQLYMHELRSIRERFVLPNTVDIRQNK